jgi:hypothetical protein
MNPLKMVNLHLNYAYTFICTVPDLKHQEIIAFSLILSSMVCYICWQIVLLHHQTQLLLVNVTCYSTSSNICVNLTCHHQTNLHLPFHCRYCNQICLLVKVMFYVVQILLLQQDIPCVVLYNLANTGTEKTGSLCVAWFDSRASNCAQSVTYRISSA